MSARASRWGVLRHPGIRKSIDTKLREVQAVLHDATKSHVPGLQAPAQHLVAAGGKGFRPVMTLVAAHFGDPDAPEVVQAAAAVELLHLASLHHDDVIDEAALRRGVPSVNARWGNLVAIRSGNFLLARSARIIAGLGDDVVDAHRELLPRLIRGQALELAGPAAQRDPVEHYFDVIADKTGVLVAGAGRIGALAAGADRETVATIGSFGERIGAAFQIADDILDITGAPEEFGKTPGTDLRGGVQTLPLLILHATPPDPDDRNDTLLRALLAGGLHNDGLVDEALVLLRGHRALAEARTRLARLVAQAADQLAGLRRCPARAAMEELCASLLRRV
ncbi:polyprenyl synthetase family protein [Actinacidiphila glaucinigra]|uniref:polyprenyl synthetase family protein n=1 Tax=Actinacidiphila glaucinigra TaxID=235986 RepID=UPI002E2F49C5|nr:polyprenyl synthetase family protein [Actinacidiphila glaucinigra]